MIYKYQYVDAKSTVWLQQ